MKFPHVFTHLSFIIISLIDEGESITPKEFKSHVQNLNLFSWLKEKYGNKIDLGFYSPDELKALERLFVSMDGIDEERKFGTTNNGLCMIIGHCLNFIQYGESEIKKMESELFKK